MNDINPFEEIALFVIVGLLALVAYLLPTMIAFGRKHHYKWVIFGINVVLGFTGLGRVAPVSHRRLSS